MSWHLLLPIRGPDDGTLDARRRARCKLLVDKIGRIFFWIAFYAFVFAAGWRLAS